MKLKKLLKTTSLIAVCATLVVGCAVKKQDEGATSSNGDVSVYLVLDRGGVQDQSFNQSAWAGAERAAEELGVEVKYLESNTDADYAQNIETAIDMDADLIIGVGFNLSEAIEDAALNYPDQQFAIVDGSFEKVPSNVTPILFDEKGAGYLAGLATAKTVQSDSNKFGFIGGFEIPAVVNYRDGFEQGLKEVNPDAVLLTQYANSFSDAAKGRVIAEQMVTKENVAAIMTAAGTTNAGTYEICAEKGVYAVGVDMAQNYLYPETIVTSAIKKVDVGVLETIRSYVYGSLESGVNSMYNISNNGVGYEKTNLLTQDTINYVDSKK